MPIIFEGISTIQDSDGSRFLITWDKADGVEIESYEIYSLSSTDSAALTGFNLLNEEGADQPGFTGDSIVSEVAPEETPEIKGKLIGIVPGGETTFLTPVLQQGGFYFQVKALAVDGRRDDNQVVHFLQVAGLTPFTGLQIAEVVGTEVVLSWLHYPFIREGEDYNYTVYKGDTFSDAIGVTKENTFTYSLENEPQGEKLSFGVRFTNGEKVEEKNIQTKSIQTPIVDDDYVGCVSYEKLGSDRIKLLFEWPSNKYFELKVFRGQTLAFSTQDREVTEFIDKGLQEGETYTYTCQGSNELLSIVGSNVLAATTYSTNPPDFAGIESAALVLKDNIYQIDISWRISTGVPADRFHVYFNAGKEVNWEKTPIHVPPTTRSYSIKDLGDDLDYSVGVRACTAICNDINFLADCALACEEGRTECTYQCDGNIEQEIRFTKDDFKAPLGTPKTTGIATGVSEAGKVVLEAPWEHQMGGIKTRYLYYKKGATAPTSKAEFEPVPIPFDVTDAANPPTRLIFDSVEQPQAGESDADQVYHFYLEDYDPSDPPKIMQTFKVTTVPLGDITPPPFLGINTIGVGPNGQEETSLDIKFTSLSSEKVDPAGASFYRVYYEEQQAEGTPEPCKSETYTDVDAELFPGGIETSYILTGLKPRKTYAICMEAHDSAGNISANSVKLGNKTKDVTPPQFFGATNATFNNTTGALDISWVASNSEDIRSYQVTVTMTDKDGEELPPFFNEYTQSDLSGVQIERQQYYFLSEATITVLVNACDNAADTNNKFNDIYNCTQFTPEDALTINLDDIEPPPGFLGILPAFEQDTSVVGEITVHWNEPTDWSEYAGFQVYFVDQLSQELVLMKDCQCLDRDCDSNNLSSCTVDGLEDYRTYKLHVRAYDDNPIPNVTTYLDKVESSADVRTIDTQKPNFIPQLDADFEEDEKRIVLSWWKATDNQYADTEDTTITYNVYRKQTTNFTTPELLSPGEGYLLKSVKENEAEFSDDGRVLAFDPVPQEDGGSLNFYIVCAQDMSGNEECDGSFKQYKTPDSVAPTLGTGSDYFRVDRATPDAKTWDLDWAMTDNLDPDGDELEVKIYEVHSQNRNLVLDPDSITSTPGYQGRIMFDFGKFTLENLSGPQDEDTWVHYLLVVSDRLVGSSSPGFVEGTGRSYQQAKVYSQNKVVISKVIPNEVTRDNLGKIVLQGSGFHSSTKVYVGDTLCGNTSIETRNVVVCEPPAQTGDILLALKVENDDGSVYISDSSESLLQYCSTTDDTCQNECNKPGMDRTDWFAAGSGQQASPRLICNREQLSLITNARPDWDYYELGANIDLSGSSWTALKTANNDGFAGYFEGNDYAVIGLNYNLHSTWDYGLFRRIRNGTSVKNLKIIGVDIYAGGRVGALAGYGHSSNTTVIDNIDVSGRIAGWDKTGGLIGEAHHNATNIRVDATVEARRQFTGGIFGWKSKGASNLYFTGSVKRITSSSHNEIFIGGIAGIWQSSSYKDTAFDLTVENAEINGRAADNSWSNSYHTGGIIGRLHKQTIKNASFQGTVRGRHMVGGIVGELHGDQARIIDSQVYDSKIYGSSQTAGAVGKIYAWGIGSESFYEEDCDRNRCENESTGEETRSQMKVNDGVFYFGFHEVKGITIENTVVSGYDNVGGIIGQAGGTSSNTILVDNFTVDDLTKVTGNNNVGGFIGQSTFVQFNSSSTSEVRASVSGVHNIGGAIGQTGRTFASNVIARGTVTSTGSDSGGFVGEIGSGDRGVEFINIEAHGNVTGSSYVGGFGGVCRGKITKSHATGNVESSLTGDVQFGGFCGWIGRPGTSSKEDIATVHSENYATGNVTSTGDELGRRCGGYVGYAEWELIISKSYATGDVSCENQSGGFVGRLGKHDRINNVDVGRGDILITESFAEGNVTGSENVGGFAAYTFYKAEFDTILVNKSYAIGNVTGEINTGGFAGLTRSVTDETFSVGKVVGTGGNVGGHTGVENNIEGEPRTSGKNFWDTTSSEMSTSHQGVGKSTELMHLPTTYSNWDSSVWRFEEGKYPRLQWDTRP